MLSINDQLEIVSEIIKTCTVDIRDEWPTASENYTKSELIFEVWCVYLFRMYA